jgi:hypothetical protein
MYGIDPDVLKKELEESNQKVTQIEKKFDTEIKATFDAAWKQWVKAYKETLNK